MTRGLARILMMNTARPLSHSFCAIVLLSAAGPGFATENGMWGSGTSPLVSIKRFDNPESGYEAYRGEITVSGKWIVFTYRDLYSSAPILICFETSLKDQKLIPRPSPDTGAPWFCMGDGSKEFFARFGVSTKMLDAIKPYEPFDISGCARITVDNYIRYTGQSEGTDSARLRMIHTRTGPRIGARNSACP